MLKEAMRELDELISKTKRKDLKKMFEDGREKLIKEHIRFHVKWSKDREKCISILSKERADITAKICTTKNVLEIQTLLAQLECTCRGIKLISE